MSEDNKAKFNELVGLVLRKLVNACPSNVKLTAATFNLPEGQFEELPEPANVLFDVGNYIPSPEEDMLSETLGWLVEEGFIRRKEGKTYVATLQALKVYGAVPSALAE